MKKRYFVYVAICFFILAGCGTNPQSTDDFIEQGLKVEREGTVQASNMNEAVTVQQTEQATPNEAETVPKTESAPQNEAVEIKELIHLMESLNDVHRRIVDTIDANGWYESMDEQPTEEAFKDAIVPIVRDYFTDSFIEEVIMNNMDAFFCYCDAPGPIQGSMKIDVMEEIDQQQQTANFYAHLPSNQINSGARFDVTVKNDNGVWKIDSWDAEYSTFEQSFTLTPDDIVHYYRNKGIDIEHIDTVSTELFPEPMYVFTENETGHEFAIHSRDWFMVEGKEDIANYLYSNESTPIP